MAARKEEERRRHARAEELRARVLSYGIERTPSPALLSPRARERAEKEGKKGGRRGKRGGKKEGKRTRREGSRFPRRLRAGAYAPSRTGSRDRDRDLGTLLERRPYSAC